MSEITNQPPDPRLNIQSSEEDDPTAVENRDKYMTISINSDDTPVTKAQQFKATVGKVCRLLIGQRVLDEINEFGADIKDIAKDGVKKTVQEGVEMVVSDVKVWLTEKKNFVGTIISKHFDLGRISESISDVKVGLAKKNIINSSNRSFYNTFEKSFTKKDMQNKELLQGAGAAYELIGDKVDDLVFHTKKIKTSKSGNKKTVVKEFSHIKRAKVMYTDKRVTEKMDALRDGIEDGSIKPSTKQRAGLELYYKGKKKFEKSQKKEPAQTASSNTEQMEKSGRSKKANPFSRRKSQNIESKSTESRSFEKFDVDDVMDEINAQYDKEK